MHGDDESSAWGARAVRVRHAPVPSAFAPPPSACSPMSRLVAGVQKYRSEEHPKRAELFRSLSGGQSPGALFICCSDSRVNPTLLTGSEPGELFVLENAGNIVPPPEDGVGGGEAATLEYAVKALRVPEIIVCGHARCGAMGGLMNPDSLGELPGVAAWVNHSTSVREAVGRDHADASPEEQLDAAIKANVLPPAGAPGAVPVRPRGPGRRRPATARLGLRLRHRRRGAVGRGGRAVGGGGLRGGRKCEVGSRK